MQIYSTIDIKPTWDWRGWKRPFLELGQKALSHEAHEESASGGVLRQYVDPSASRGTKEMDLFQQAPLGNGIRSTRQAEEIPDDQEQNADKFRKRRRDMKESAT